tara:strand:+ start:160 stop:879 length:720 start_codon:yes stop_codon:yes gene_type:complete
MAVNHYFQGGRGIGNDSEKRLHEDIIIESLKIFGQDIYYLPRTLVNRDLVLGEDTSSRFDDSYLLEMYFETTEGFAGENEIINKFGLEIRDDTTLVLSKRRFQDHVASKATLTASGRPNEGDIVFVPLLNSYFEIQFVEDQEPFYQMGNLPVYKLKVTRWEYANEQINTGINTLDAVEDKYTLDQLQHKLTFRVWSRSSNRRRFNCVRRLSRLLYRSTSIINARNICSCKYTDTITICK